MTKSFHVQIQIWIYLSNQALVSRALIIWLTFFYLSQAKQRSKLLFEMENKPRVFINFRGKDLRLTFVPHLKYHLKHNNVNVFTDDDLTGKPLENLLKYIKKSRIVIVIFSISYLESKWCARACAGQELLKEQEA